MVTWVVEVVVVVWVRVLMGLGVVMWVVVVWRVVLVCVEVGVVVRG